MENSTSQHLACSKRKGWVNIYLPTANRDEQILLSDMACLLTKRASKPGKSIEFKTVCLDYNRYDTMLKFNGQDENMFKKNQPTTDFNII